MTENERIAALGAQGEALVRNWLTYLGHKVYDSVDYYDNEKDFLCDGKKCEVKTQQPHVKKNALTFRRDQLLKCFNRCHKLFFVATTALYKTDYEHANAVYYIDIENLKPGELKFHEYVQHNIDMIAIDIVQKPVVKLCDIPEEQQHLFERFLDSRYK